MEEEQDKNHQNPVISFNFSAEFGKLVEALSKAVPTFKAVTKEATNPFFKSKYTDLSALVDATREPLAKQGLIVAQFPGKCEGNTISLTTMLLHSSNQFLRGELWMPFGKNDAQSIGSAVTYAKRYSYSAMLNLIADLDDDGEGAMPSRNNEVREDLNEKMEGQARIGQFQVKAITEACQKAAKSTVEQSEYLERLHIKQWEQLQKQDFQTALKWAIGIKTPAKVSGPEGHAVEMKRIFATAADRGVPENDVKRYAYETHKVDSMTKLGKPQLQEVLDWVSGA